MIGSILGSCSQEAQEVQSRPSSRQYSVDDFLNTKSYYNGLFSFDEERLFFSSNETGIDNVYSIDVTGGDQKQLTKSENEAAVLIAVFPEDDRFIFTSDISGNEIYHLYLQEKDGTIVDLTPGEGVRAVAHSWSHDRKSLYYTSNRRNPKAMDLYEMDIENFTPKLIFQNDQGFGIGDISPDRHYLALTKLNSCNDSDLFLFDFDTQTLKNLTAHTGEVSNTSGPFTVDSKNLYFFTDEGSDFRYLRCYNIESQESTLVEKREWDIVSCGFSHDGRYRSILINEDGCERIKIFDLVLNKPFELPVLQEGDIVAARFSKSSRKILLATGGDRTPSNYYVYDIAAKSCIKLTNALSPHMNMDDLIEGEVIRYSSYDGLSIPAIYYKPHGLKETEKAPALIFVHGGPGGQSTKGFNAMFQFLANQGYAILAVNNRGSSGYGKNFYKAADRKHGEADLDDCIWAKKYLVSTGQIDENKIGIIGGSYGGYMTLAALAFRPQEMAVGIDIVGVSNWIRTLKSTPSWWEFEREALYKKIGNPETDEAYLRSISPLFHAEKIAKPLLVIQGANDPRVLKVESDQIVEAVQKNKIPCTYLLFEDEGHGFGKKENMRIALLTISEFLDAYLKGNNNKK